MSLESSNYIKFLAIRVSPDGEIDDNIEIISTEYDVIDKSNRTLQKPRKSILEELKFFQDEGSRKKLTRGIIVIGSVFILLSGILLIVSLSMSKDIDEVVRNSNDLLRDKVLKPSTGPRVTVALEETGFNSTGS